MPCKQGRISLYSAVVQNARHIQEAVRFAKRHNIRLAIKNSGHDFLGRSAAPNSLQILTNRMKGLQLVDDFVPKGAPKHKGEGPAVTLDAGISLQEMYAALGKRNRTVVGGSAHTVGPTGGYIQGGGHSFLSPWKGMASDNALEFSVVTAAVSWNLLPRDHAYK
jgi:FAD/FMN-containing dehydrogenase